MSKKQIAILLAVAMAFAVTACGNGNTQEAQTEASTQKAKTEEPSASLAEEEAKTPSTEDSDITEGFPFELTTYNDMVVTFTKVPETVIAANSNTADQLFAMGLGDKISYVCYKNSEINPAFQAEYDSKEVLNEQAATLEQLLEVSPDFIYGRSSAFSEKNGTTHDILTSYGIASLSSIEGYKLGADVEDVYEDFYNLGRIFQLEDKAQKIVDEMKSKVAQVDEKIAGSETVRVFVFDALMEDGPYTCGNNFTAQLIRHAGGQNIFEDLDTTWSTVSWETVVERDPEVIIINDYGATSLEEKIAQLKENPALSDITAIKNDRIISVHLCEVFASSMTADTIVKFAEACHPECFE
ncbi:MAG: ABC transporter substrate-binding protein [Lachnospiraceae bacterium]|nr:ABC transporter substrate-binding protein [Lachnospiraceae bacterium]